jgi:Ca2+-binding RTX toxin-like protein
MSVIMNFDFSLGKTSFNTSVNGTVGSNDSIGIKSTYSISIADWSVVNGSLVYSSYSYFDNIVSTIILPNFGAHNFIEYIDRSGSPNPVYNITYRLVNSLDNSKSTDALAIIGTEGADTIKGPSSTVSVIYGGAGDDVINGGSSANSIYGGSGSNTLSGDSGDDAYRVFTEDKAIDTIIDTDGSNDTLAVLLPSVVPENNYNWGLKRDGNDLTGKIYDSMGGSYSFTIKNQYTDTGGIEGLFILPMGGPLASNVRGNLDVKSTTQSTYLYAGTDSDEMIRITGLGAEKTGVHVWGNAGADAFIRNESLTRVTYIGGDGLDTIEYSGKRSDYTVEKSSSPYTKDVVNTVVKTSAVNKTVSDFVMAERLIFTDTSLAMDIDGNAGSVAKILSTVFGKEALTNKTYAGIGLQLLDSGMSSLALAELAINLGKPSNSQIVDTLWNNLYGTATPETTKSYLVNLLDSQAMSAGSLTLKACELNQNIDLVGLATKGLPFIQQG